MTQYKTMWGEKVDVPDKIDIFVEEYISLCKKHKLMIVSVWESITVESYKEGGWALKESIADKIANEKEFKDKG